VEWITFEDPHVAEYHDPDIVKRASEGKELTQMLLDGEIVAGIVGDTMPTPPRRTGPSATTVFRSTTWWWSGRNCRVHGPTRCRTSTGGARRAPE
jgi:4,5-dihydroxyphthalate decarboxylase